MSYNNIVSTIAAIIDQNAQNSFTLGTDLFIGHIPPDPENAMMVLAAGGEPPDMYLDTSYAVIDIWIRDRHSDAGYDKMLTVFNQLQRLSNIQLNNYHLYFLHAITNIQDMDRDTEKRKLYKITFRAIYRNTNIVS